MGYMGLDEKQSADPLPGKSVAQGCGLGLGAGAGCLLFALGLIFALMVLGQMG